MTSYPFSSKGTVIQSVCGIMTGSDFFEIPVLPIPNLPLYRALSTRVVHFWVENKYIINIFKDMNFSLDCA